MGKCDLKTCVYEYLSIYLSNIYAATKKKLIGVNDSQFALTDLNVLVALTDLNILAALSDQKLESP